MKKHPVGVSIAIAEKPKAHAQRAAMMKKHPVGVSIAKRRMKKADHEGPLFFFF